MQWAAGWLTDHTCCVALHATGLMEPGPLRGGGGMHVGPGDPIFGPGRMGGGVGGPPGHGPGMPGLPPGARWDPIAPPGMRGFHPGQGLWRPQGLWGRLVAQATSNAVSLRRAAASWQRPSCGFVLLLPENATLPNQPCAPPPNQPPRCYVSCSLHLADDYQQQPGRVHPDMAQPGPGRGTDFDQMFG